MTTEAFFEAANRCKNGSPGLVDGFQYGGFPEMGVLHGTAGTPKWMVYNYGKSYIMDDLD